LIVRRKVNQIQRYRGGSKSNLLGSVVALAGILLATAIFTVRQWNPPVSVSIDVGGSAAETSLRMAEVEREQAEKMQHLNRVIHMEMAGLSILFIAVLVFAFRDARLPRWSRDILLMCAGVIAVGCFTRW
jgi:hypothetical protein